VIFTTHDENGVKSCLERSSKLRPKVAAHIEYYSWNSLLRLWNVFGDELRSQTSSVLRNEKGGFYGRRTNPVRFYSHKRSSELRVQPQSNPF
jgi:hypothetical protein